MHDSSNKMNFICTITQRPSHVNTKIQKFCTFIIFLLNFLSCYAMIGKRNSNVEGGIPVRPYTTAERLRELMSVRKLRQVDILNAAAPFCHQFGIKLNKNDLSQYVSGKVTPRYDKLSVLALALNVSEMWLLGYAVPMQRDYDDIAESTRWSRNFIENMDAILAYSDPADVEAALIDTALLDRISDGSEVLTLDLAGRVAEDLGESLAFMVGELTLDEKNTVSLIEDSKTWDIVDMMLRLPDDKMKQAVSFLHYLATNEGNQ